MMDILDYISTWSVLKWVVLVLIAGFIGQFGKILAEAIITKVRGRREAGQVQSDHQSSETESAVPPQTKQSSFSAASGEMFDKKMLKALAKARKKETKNK